MNSVIQSTIQQLQDIQSGKPWVGSSYASMLTKINERNAFIRPHRDLLSVAEILSHLTLWRQECVLKINTGQGSKTTDSEENWLSNEQLQPMGWQHVLIEYDKTLTDLVGLLNNKNDDFLDETYFDTDFNAVYPYRFVIEGMLHHDLYHLGQLGIVIKFLKATKSIN